VGGEDGEGGAIVWQRLQIGDAEALEKSDTVLAAHLRLQHVADVEEAAVLAHVSVRRRHALAVLYRQQEAGELHHAASALHVEVVETGFARGRLRAGQSHGTGAHAGANAGTHASAQRRS